MKRISRLIAVVGALTFVVSGALSAQGKSSAGRPAQHTAVAHPANPSNAKPAEQHDSFRGIATKLGMTSGELESAYQTAKQANPKLTHGQFVAANMVAHNLGSKNPAITTPAILSGLQSGGAQAPGGERRDTSNQTACNSRRDSTRGGTRRRYQSGNSRRA